VKNVPVLITIILLFSLIPTVLAQDEYTPLSMHLTIYSDGNVRMDYLIETDPTKVRIDFDLFGAPYNNLVARDDEGLPLIITATGTNVTVDSLGAFEVNIQYLTSTLTVKEGALWTLNISSPASTRITLPSGAAIIYMGVIPTNIGISDGKQYLDFDPGDLSVSYILGLPGVVQEAADAIEAAENFITQKKAAGIILSGPEETLDEAETALAQDDYLTAKTMADSALSEAQSIVETVQDAETAISLAEAAVTAAQENGRVEGLTEAETALRSAETSYENGDYAVAEMEAGQAYQLALSASKPQGGGLFLYLGVLVVVAGIAGGYMYIQRSKESTPSSAISPQTSVKKVNLDKIFFKFDHLRLEEKEVLRFLAGRNGEAFASEIRDRFDMPRSTAWRLMRRLVEYGLVEETKVGNQSLIRIISEYTE
jgi:uncharacterized membrane protein